MPSVFSYSEAGSHPLGMPHFVWLILHYRPLLFSQVILSFISRLIVSWHGCSLFKQFSCILRLPTLIRSVVLLLILCMMIQPVLLLTASDEHTHSALINSFYTDHTTIHNLSGNLTLYVSGLLWKYDSWVQSSTLQVIMWPINPSYSSSSTRDCSCPVWRFMLLEPPPVLCQLCPLYTTVVPGYAHSIQLNTWTTKIVLTSILALTLSYLQLVRENW
jgi:hypothetical protein